jgi:hypothetical protein
MIRPRGKPPTPSARSTDNAPVEMTSIFFWEGAFPNRMILPSPKVLVMDCIAVSRLRCLSVVGAPAAEAALDLDLDDDLLAMF